MAGLIVGIGAGVAALGSAANIFAGASRSSKAQKVLENFKRQELKNITAGMRVSTLGAELQTQEAQRRFATSVDALSSGGVRGLVGGLGQQEQSQQAEQQRIAAGLDEQQIRIDQMAAEDEARMRSIQEGRESAAIAGLGMEVAAGRNQVAQGIGGIAQAGMSMVSAGIGGIDSGGAMSSDLIKPQTTTMGLTNIANIATSAGNYTQGLSARNMSNQGYIPMGNTGVPKPNLSGLRYKAK